MFINIPNKKDLPGGTKADIMGKYGGLVDIVVSMNSINTINHRYSKPS